MVDVDQVDDVKTLRQVIHLYEQEVDRLQKRIRELVGELALKTGKDETKQVELEIVRLHEELSQLRHRVFGESSERRARETKPPQPKKPRTGHGPRKQVELPIREVVHDLPEDQRSCPACDGQLEVLGDATEDFEEITVVRRNFVLERHRRKKYRCRCNGAVVTAPAPPRLIPGGRYSTEFAVEVAVAKYTDHMPLERQVRTMARDSLVVDSQTLWDQINALARWLAPTYEAVRQLIVARPVVGADETPWRMMRKGSSKKWQVWTLAVADAVYYEINPSRGADAARKALGECRGVIMCDGYQVYKVLAKETPDLKLANCWSHVRRKFFEARKAYAKECDEALDFIDELFMIEREAPNPDKLDGEARHDALLLRAKLRNERSRPVVEELERWAKQQKALPQSSFRKALEYMLQLWGGLTVFLDDPRVPLSNNHTEREIRPVVVGRKNHYGSRSQRGTEVAALFYTLLETAKLCGVDPREYLLKVAHAAIDTPGTVLLPHDLSN